MGRRIAEVGHVALADRLCAVCTSRTPPTRPEDAARWLGELPQWRLEDGRLVRELRLPDFASALAWVDALGALAESVGHHPDLAFGWGWLRVTLWTHAIGALSDADFVLAAKIDRVLG
ncbi:MAG: 4a-hydroxytetrahydrobiopterin dehydratase [Myxococcota bacterium]